MRTFIGIINNAFWELARQPIFLLLLASSCAFSVFTAIVPYFAMDDDINMVKDGTMAVMLLSGLLGAVLCASSSLSREIQTGTALAVLSKPVGRSMFLLGKYFGLAGGLVLLCYTNSLASLVSSRMAYDAYGGVDFNGAGVWFGMMALGLGAAGFSNYFLRRGFVSDAVFSLVITQTMAFIIIAFFLGEHDNSGSGATGIDWEIIPVAVLVMFAVWLLAAVALACSTRLDAIPTLSVCSVIFLLGLMSDYLFGRSAETGHFFSKVAYAVLPNWQLLWLADALHTNGVPWSYVGTAAIYLVAYLVAVLSIGLMLFQDRDLT
ncbi:hypothetical protein N9B94_00440 [Verrucomicrobia bacterium]|nr:hypothetical protein [Verrucomicrobiota bacterium]